MAKRITTILLIFIMLCGEFNISTASSMDNCNSFLGNYYEVFSYDFDDGANYNWGTVLSDIDDTDVLKIFGSTDLLGGSGGFVGKSYLSFDLMADNIDDFEFSARAMLDDKSLIDAVTLALVKDDTDINVSLNNAKSGVFLAGQWVKFEFLFDGTDGKAVVIVSSKEKELLRKTLSFDENNVILSSLELGGRGYIYIDNVALCRAIRCNGDKTAVFGDGAFISASSSISADDNLYLAQYRKDILIDYATSKNTFKSTYTEVYLKADIKQGDVFKAFVWNDDLSPSKINAVVKNENIITKDFVMTGSVSTTDVIVGEQADFDISFSDGYDGDIAIIIRSENGQEWETVQNVSDDFYWTPSKPGEYTVWLYTVKDSLLVPAANLRFYAVPYLSDDDTFMFPAEKSYYVHNGVKVYYDKDGYIPFLNDGHIYINPDMIKYISGIDVSDGKVSYLNEVLMEFDENSGASADGSDYTLKIKDGHYSFGDLCTLIGYESTIQEDVVCVTRANDVSIYDYEDLLFEFVAKKKSSGFFNWSTKDSTGAEYDSATDIHTVEAIQSAYAGFSYEFLEDNFDAYMYEVSFDVMYSDDAQNIAPFIGMWTKKDGEFYNIYHGSEITGGKCGEWTRVSSCFAKYTMDNAGFDEVDKFYIGLKPSGSGTATGKLMFKNVRIREKSIMNESVESEIVCKNFAAWHILGQKVSFISKGEGLKQFESICGVIYDSDGKKVFEKTVSTRSFLQNGWEWIPEEVGYYEAEFYGIRNDGSKNIIVNCYSHKYGNECTVYTLPRHSIAVVKSEAKPMDERSDLLMLSDDARNEDSIKLANMVGFSGIRIHGVHWGDSVQIDGFHTADKTFDWTTTDLQIENIKKYGFKNVIANIFGTPRWAVTDSQVVNKGYTSVGLYSENCYVPDDISVVSDGFGAYAERYKNDINGIEVWNEPSYGNTAFWYQAGNSNEEMYNDFAAITVAAYSAIKEKAPNITVYSAGFNQAYKLFGELLENEEYAQSFDAISCHGRYSDPEVYFDILNQKGMNDKPVINSEGYFYAYHTKGMPKDYSANNMAFIMNYLQHIKLGTDKITHFSLLDVTEDELRVNNNASNCAGLFRKYPYIEPLSGAITAYNFFSGLGKNVSFGNEFDFGNGIKAVSLNSDDEKQIYLWSSSDNDFYIPGELIGCMSNKSAVVDFEGRNIEKNLKLSANRIYCIKNVDSSSLNNLISAPDSALNSDFVAPYYTCRTEDNDAADTYNPISGVFTSGALFDNESFSDNDKKAYNSDGEVWIPVDGKARDCDAKYALSFDSEGMYVEAVVTDSEHFVEATKGDEIVQNDGIRFAIDSYGRLRNTERSEFFVGIVNGKPSVYKYYAADLSEAVVEGWSPSGTMLKDGYADIQRDSDKGVTTYKVYIPYSEIYPFMFVGDNEVRFALAISDNDGGVQKGYLSFGEGIASELPQVWKYIRMQLSL